MAGFVLKSHYTSTAERASVVSAAVPGVQVLGAIALNRAVGGLNPLAVEVAAREGARTVWMPTVDSVNESHEREAPPGRQGPGVGQAPARAARAGPRDRARAGRRRAGGGAARDRDGARADRAPPDACWRPATSAATRSSRSSMRRARQGVERDRRSPTRSSRRRIYRSTTSGRSPSAARCSSAASRRRTPAR